MICPKLKDTYWIRDRDCIINV